jgi:hypothetical protein
VLKSFGDDEAMLAKETARLKGMETGGKQDGVGVPSGNRWYDQWAMLPLLQAEADSLRTMPKRLTAAARAEFGMPAAGEGRTFMLESLDGRTAFLMDVNRRGKIKLSRCSYLERFRVTDILARLDIDGPPHTNPTVARVPLERLQPHNGALIPCPHFHFYVQGYEDRWAVPAAEEGFGNMTDLVAALREFMVYCGVQDVPTIQYPIQ